MRKVITREEVQTYADALIAQYIERRGITELSQLGLSHAKEDPRRKGTYKFDENEVSNQFPPINGDAGEFMIS